MEEDEVWDDKVLGSSPLGAEAQDQAQAQVQAQDGEREQQAEEEVEEEVEVDIDSGAEEGAVEGEVMAPAPEAEVLRDMVEDTVEDTGEEQDDVEDDDEDLEEAEVEATSPTIVPRQGAMHDAPPKAREDSEGHPAWISSIGMREVAAVLKMARLEGYADRMFELGYDDLFYLRFLHRTSRLDEVTKEVGMKPGHRARFVDKVRDLGAA